MGYPHYDSQELFDKIHLILDGARRARMQTVLGGDFNTQLQSGIRGEAVTNLSTNFDLQIVYEDARTSTPSRFFVIPWFSPEQLISFCPP